jgi:hypothetical protein
MPAPLGQESLGAPDPEDEKGELASPSASPFTAEGTLSFDFPGLTLDDLFLRDQIANHFDVDRGPHGVPRGSLRVRVTVELVNDEPVTPLRRRPSDGAAP